MKNLKKVSIDYQGFLLCAITAVSATGIGLLTYMQFTQPQEFDAASNKISRPELMDEETKVYGVFGSILDGKIPESVSMFLLPKDAKDFAKKRQEANAQRKLDLQEKLDSLK